MKFIKDYKTYFINEKLNERYDLEKIFDELNQIMWNGELKPIELKWENIKSSGGRVISERDKKTGIETIKYLGISTFYDIDYEKLINIMAHELIHVYMIQNGIKDYDGYHGMIFKDYMKKFNEKGFNITILHDVSEIGVSNKERLKKPVGVILAEDRQTKNRSISAINYDEMLTNIELHKDRVLHMAKVKKSTYTLWFIECYNSEIKKYSIARNYKKMSYYKVSDEIWNDMLNEKIIENVILNEL